MVWTKSKLLQCGKSRKQIIDCFRKWKGYQDQCVKHHEA